MKNILKFKKLNFTCAPLFIAFLTAFFMTPCAFGADDIDVKTQAYALYNTNNGTEALKLLNNLSSDKKDEEVYVIIANIYQDRKDVDRAVENLNKALILNPEYYKAYYNLGCIFLEKKAYELAEKNLLLSIKHNKEFAYSYYNLGTLYLRTGNYEKAKKNLIKAIYLKNDDKDFYLNLAYAYKFLNKEKESKKMLEIYNGATKAEK